CSGSPTENRLGEQPRARERWRTPGNFPRFGSSLRDHQFEKLCLAERQRDIPAEPWEPLATAPRPAGKLHALTDKIWPRLAYRPTVRAPRGESRAKAVTPGTFERRTSCQSRRDVLRARPNCQLESLATATKYASGKRRAPNARPGALPPVDAGDAVAASSSRLRKNAVVPRPPVRPHSPPPPAAVASS